jgi:hypothetical protein
MPETPTPGEKAYAAYVRYRNANNPFGGRELTWEECAADHAAWAAAAQAVLDAGLPVRQRERAWCIVCQQPLDAGTVYCPDHPQSDIMVVLRDAAGGQGPWPCQTLAGEEDTP